MTSRLTRISRQGTFETDPADFVSEEGIRRGNIQFPVIDDNSIKPEPHPLAQTTPPDQVTGKGLHSKPHPAEPAKPPHQPAVVAAAEPVHDKVDSGRTFTEPPAKKDTSGSNSVGESSKTTPSVEKETPHKEAEPSKDGRRKSISKSSSDEGKKGVTSGREKSFTKTSSVETEPLQKAKDTHQHHGKSAERITEPPSESKGGQSKAGAEAEGRAATPSQPPREASPPMITSKPPESTQRPGDTAAMTDLATRRKNLARANARKSEAQPSDFPGRYSPVRTPDLDVERPTREDSISPHTYRPRDAKAGTGAGQETFENVRAERDSLLRSEAAYKKRIKLLEEDSKQFLKKIEEISQENILLRDRMEMLESSTPAAAAPAAAPPPKDKADDGDGVSRREYEKLKKENATLKDTILQLERECSQLNHNNKKLHSVSMADQSKIRDREYLVEMNADLTQKCKDHEKKIRDLESEKESMAKSLTAMESAQMTRADDLKTENKKLEAELRNQQKANEEAEARVTGLKAENKTLSETLAKKREELEELMRALKSDESAAEELKKTQAELAVVKETMAKVEKDRQADKAKAEEVNAEKARLARELSEVRVNLKEVKVGSGEKERVVVDLRSQLQKLRTEKEESQQKIDQLTSENAELRQLRTEVANLKIKVRTLQGDLSSSKDTNRKLERDNEDKQAEIERLQRELNRERDEQARLRRELEGRVSESEEVQRLRMALEAERARHQSIDEDMERKKQDIARLEQHTFEMNIKVETLNNKMKEVEEERRKELERGLQLNDLELANKQLSEENARLRQSVVERNFENTAHRSDKEHLITRLELLEQRQEDSEIQVKQMRGWMHGINKHKQHPSTEIVVATTTAVAATNGRSPRAKSPATTGIGRRSRKPGGGVSRTSKAVTYDDVRMHDIKQLDLALEDASSTPSLPPIEEVRVAKPITYTNGYYQIYKNKRRLVRERR